VTFQTEENTHNNRKHNNMQQKPGQAQNVTHPLSLVTNSEQRIKSSNFSAESSPSNTVTVVL
jgi:hypothetical protein